MLVPQHGISLETLRARRVPKWLYIACVCACSASSKEFPPSIPSQHPPSVASPLSSSSTFSPFHVSGPQAFPSFDECDSSFHSLLLRSFLPSSPVLTSRLEICLYLILALIFFIISVFYCFLYYYYFCFFSIVLILCYGVAGIILGYFTNNTVFGIEV